MGSDIQTISINHSLVFKFTPNPHGIIFHLQPIFDLLPVISPIIEPYRLLFSKTNNMNADCAPINSTRVGDCELVMVQRPIQLRKPHEEGVLER